MNRKNSSKSSLEIKATPSEIWEALTNRETAKAYFFGAEITTDWTIGNPIVFRGAFNGNTYEEKGIILQAIPNILLQYTHWSNLEGIPDIPENYRIWTFELAHETDCTLLTITEDNIPTEKQKLRSDEFWAGVLTTIKGLVE